MYYVYRFLNTSKEVIYVGLTRDFERRIYGQHFADKGHLPPICYKETDKVEYIKFDSEVDMLLYEIYFINTLKPKYNTRDKTNDKSTITMPQIEWVNLHGFKAKRQRETRLREQITTSKDIFKVKRRFRDAEKEMVDFFHMLEFALEHYLTEGNPLLEQSRKNLTRNMERTIGNIEEILEFKIPTIRS